MKKIFDIIWNLMVGAVIAGCILAILFFSYNVSNQLNRIEDEIIELYEIAVYRPIVNEKMYQKYQEKLDTVYKKINNRIDEEKEELKPLPYIYLKKVTVRLIGKKKADDVKGWLGTGIIVKITEDFTYILTNKHVAKRGSILYIHEDGKWYSTEILKNSAFEDLALVRMNGRLYGKTVVRGFSDHKIQEKIYSVGEYLTNNFIYTEGSVAGITKSGKLLVNLPCAGGCSGSGIFNSDGEVVGLLFGSYMLNYLSSDTSKALCIPSSKIRLFLEEIL